jgi:hypothetical protein
MSVNKLFMALAGTLVFALKGYFDDGQLTLTEWLQLIVLGLGVLYTWLIPNTPLLATAKTWVYGLTAGIALLITSLPDGVSGTEWFDILIVVGTTVGIFTVPNRPATIVRPAVN